MAALIEGQNYGLSSRGNFHDNKTRIFVKLTDAALKAIEGYNNRGGSGRHPSIQFSQTHGVIKIPSAQNPGTEHLFTFSLSSNADEGLQGSFECIQQNGRCLDSLGSMQYKMHIQAKDDVYEATKHRMAVAEEESKKNCTKVIKVSGPYVGRKVKVKKPNIVIPPKPSSPTYAKHSIAAVPSKPVSNGHATAPSTNNGFHSQYNNKAASNNKSGNPEIMRKTYRERIIHLLAIRPYKKPELLARLMKDGVREKDKKSLSSILSQVATMKENTYTLAKHAFTEIQEEWPFYSEPDRQLLKRRLQQNSAALGNDSPTNVQPSSSPTPTPTQPPVPKRNSSDPDPMPPKRQRISHFISKPEVPNGQTSSQKPDTFQSNNSVGKTDSPSPSSSSSSSSNTLNGLSRISNFSNSSSNVTDGDVRSANCGLNGESNGYHLKKIELNGQVSNKGKPDGHSDDYSHKADSNGRLSSSSGTHNSSNGNRNGHHPLQENFSRQLNVPAVTTNGRCAAAPIHSPDLIENEDFHGTLNALSNGNCDVAKLDNCDYIKKYADITNDEQRARYKADFNAEYEEYRCLHGVVDQVSKRFSILKDNLRNAKENSDDWLKIRDQIVNEYSASKRNQEYQAAKRRFQYMHEKLAHIKRLVAEYDQENGIDS